MVWLVAVLAWRFDGWFTGLQLSGILCLRGWAWVEFALGLWSCIAASQRWSLPSILVYDLHLRTLIWYFGLMFCDCCYCLLLSWVCFAG